MKKFTAPEAGAQDMINMIGDLEMPIFFLIFFQQTQIVIGESGITQKRCQNLDILLLKRDI